MDSRNRQRLSGQSTISGRQSSFSIWSRQRGPAGTFADFLNRRRHDGHVVLRMMKLQVHAPADVTNLEHRTSPCGARDGHRHRLRTIQRMPRDHDDIPRQYDQLITSVLGVDLQVGTRFQILQSNSALNFRPNKIVVYLVTEVRVGLKGTRGRHEQAPCGSLH